MLQVSINSANAPELPSSLREWLRAFDPDLRVRVFKLGTTWQWTVCQKWPENDPRWARVQSQQVSPDDAFDIVAWLPPTITLDDLPGYLERGMIAVGRSHEYVAQHLNRVRAANQKNKDAAWNEVEDRLMEAAQDVSNFANHADGNVVFEAGARIASAGIPGSANGPAVKDKA